MADMLLVLVLVLILIFMSRDNGPLYLPDIRTVKLSLLNVHDTTPLDKPLPCLIMMLV